MTAKLRPFSDMFAGWPPGVPDTLPELIEIDFAALKILLENGDPEIAEIVYAQRAHGVEVRNASTLEAPLSNPDAVARALGVTIRPPKDRWITYVLDHQHRRVSAPHKHSGSRYLNDITVKVPAPDQLTELGENGHYLLVRNDTPAVLEIPGVLERLGSLCAATPLNDVVIYDVTDPDNPIVYSLRALCGRQGHARVAFELPEIIMTKVRSLWPAQSL